MMRDHVQVVERMSNIRRTGVQRGRSRHLNSGRYRASGAVGSRRSDATFPILLRSWAPLALESTSGDHNMKATVFYLFPYADVKHDITE
jgi:hypothetical protein